MFVQNVIGFDETFPVAAPIFALQLIDDKRQPFASLNLLLQFGRCIVFRAGGANQSVFPVDIHIVFIEHRMQNKTRQKRFPRIRDAVQQEKHREIDHFDPDRTAGARDGNKRRAECEIHRRIVFLDAVWNISRKFTFRIKISVKKFLEERNIVFYVIFRNVVQIHRFSVEKDRVFIDVKPKLRIDPQHFFFRRKRRFGIRREFFYIFVSQQPNSFLLFDELVQIKIFLSHELFPFLHRQMVAVDFCLLRRFFDNQRLDRLHLLDGRQFFQFIQRQFPNRVF